MTNVNTEKVYQQLVTASCAIAHAQTACLCWLSNIAHTSRPAYTLELLGAIGDARRELDILANKVEDAGHGGN